MAAHYVADEVLHVKVVQKMAFSDNANITRPGFARRRVAIKKETWEKKRNPEN